MWPPFLSTPKHCLNEGAPKDIFGKNPQGEGGGAKGAYWTPARKNIKKCLLKAEPNAGFEQIDDFPDSVYNRSRITTDEGCVLKNGNSIYIGERKATTVELGGEHPAVEYQKYLDTGVETNLSSSVVQLFTYMIACDGVRYGFVSNWKNWFFVKRDVAEDGGQTLLLSKYYKHDNSDGVNARLAYAFFLSEALKDPGYLPLGGRGYSRENKDTKKFEKQGDDDEEDRNPDVRRAGALLSIMRVFGLDKKSANEGADSKRSKRALPKYEVSVDALDVLIPLCLMRDSKCLSFSDKASVHRGMVNGQDLVWKLVDFYGTPRRSEWTDGDLNQMMDNEIRVYAHLKSVQGDIVPKFVFCGSDFNFLFVFVTTYEGESLNDDDKAVDLDFVLKARNGLLRLHELGVVHGDVAKRNILQRMDGNAVWIDFERSELKDDFKREEDFMLACVKELNEFDALFNFHSSGQSLSMTIVDDDESTDLFFRNLDVASFPYAENSKKSRRELISGR